MNSIRHLIAKLHRVASSWGRGKGRVPGKERQMEFDFTVRRSRSGRRMG